MKHDDETEEEEEVSEHHGSLATPELGISVPIAHRYYPP